MLSAYAYFHRAAWRYLAFFQFLSGTILRRGIPAIRSISDDILFRYTYVYHREKFDEKVAILYFANHVVPSRDTDHESVSVANEMKNAHC